MNDKTPAISHLRHDFDKTGSQDMDIREIEVQTVTLDKFVFHQDVDFIKLDLEGADFLTLLGAKDLLSRDRPVCVFENSRAWAAKCYSYDGVAFFNFFDELGYSLYDLHSFPLTPETWSSQDLAFEFLAIHKEDQHLNRIIFLMQDFWNSIGNRPVLENWEECVRAVRNPKYWQPDFSKFNCEQVALTPDLS